jgi:hypothetical protein
MSTVQIDVKRSLARTVAMVQARGPKGADGTDGKASQILYGTGIPGAGFGQNEDTYVDTATGDFYRKEEGAWLYRANMLGPHGWSPKFSVVANGFKRHFQLVDWVGGGTTSVKPPILSGGLAQYISATGYTTDINLAQDIAAPWGWSPVYAAVTDALRRVFQLSDYVGGTGTKPSVLSGGNPQYLGPTGLTTTLASATDFRGLQGYDGWEPVLANEADGQRIVQKIVDWIGGGGTKPALPSPAYIGSTGYVALASATDIRGAQGYAGWAPVFGIVSDGLRRVLQLTDWTGGAGTKPAIGTQYVGAAGMTNTISFAVDIRGPQGIQGDNTTATAVTTAANNSFSSTTVQGALVEIADNSIVNALIF